MTQKPRIIIFATKTGGGHWSPAMAIAEEITRLSEGMIEVEVVDGLYGENGIGLLVERGYSLLIRRARLLWGSFFLITNHRLPLYFNNTVLFRVMKKIRNTLRNGSTPLAVVCTNSMILRPIGKVLQGEPNYIPFINVVTDLVTVHRAWAERAADLVLSPAPMATESLVAMHRSSYKILETGLPVSRDFHPLTAEEKCELRLELGLDPDRPLIVLMHGAEGHQRLAQIASLLNEKFGPALQQVVICGKNQPLREKIEGQQLGQHVQVLGFTRQVSRYMKAADLLVTKAGSLTVSEALACGCPMIISENLPGQESGTPEWLEENGASIVAHNAGKLVAEVEQLLANPSRLESMSANAQKLGRPEAASQAAEAVLQLVKSTSYERPHRPSTSRLWGRRFLRFIDPVN